MSDEAKPPVLWSTVITRWAVVLLLAVVIVIALRPTVTTWFVGEKKHSTSGDAADIRLVGVVPDGDDDLFNPRGQPLGQEFKWPGERTYTWSPQQMQRDFLFELGPGTENLEFLRDNAGTVTPSDRRGWISSSSIVLGRERVPTADGRTRILLRANLSQTSWRRVNFFSSGQQPVEEVDVSLQFYPPQRGRAQANFTGPFTPGVTNRPRESLPAHLIVLTNAPQLTAQGAAFRAWGTGFVGPYDRLLIYDTDGKRHFPENNSSWSGPMGWTNEFVVPGVPLARVAAVTVGEQPRVKTFHNIVVKYPDRPPLTHSPVLDRLAAALGKTNLAAANLEHYSPRDAHEAVIVLAHRPGNRNAISMLAHNVRTTNFMELTAMQRELLRTNAMLAAASIEHDRRGPGLRIGLRAGWPEFTALALTRLTNGPPQDRIDAAYALSSPPPRHGPEHIPILAALARTNDPPGLGSQLIYVINALRDPAATNALLELARADEPWLWWPAIAVLRMKDFEPLQAQSAEMQQRVVLVKDLTNAPVDAAVLAAARARLPGLCTAALRDSAYGSFNDAMRRVATQLDRATAMAVMMNYLRSESPEFWKNTPPLQIVQQVNAWYGKDFGDGKKKPYTYLANDAWPGVIEDVLEFYDRLKRDGKVETGK